MIFSYIYKIIYEIQINGYQKFKEIKKVYVSIEMYITFGVML